jgi:hypothetical protein
MKRSPIKRHAVKRKPGDVDKEYVAWIHSLKCCVPYCVTHIDRAYARVEAHHAGDHGLAQRAPDRTCIPLCVWHHREGGDSIHRMGSRFWGAHGLERDTLIAKLNAEYDAQGS